jgi:N-methylhydantoinase B
MSGALHSSGDGGSSTSVVVNPVEREVLRYALIAAADEMRITLMRAAYNPVIYEIGDVSCGVFDARCRMVAQADGVPLFLGNLSAAVRTVVEEVGADELRPGDLYLINDPYTTGPHLNDVTAVAPVFDERNNLLALTAARAHWVDIGGKDPVGSTDSTDIRQEGLLLRSVKLYDQGRLNEGVRRMIEHNVRYPRNMLGDLQATVAASRTGSDRVRTVVARYGRDRVEAAIDDILAQGERRSRAAIAGMRDGVYRASSCLDDDGLGNGPIPIHVCVIVRGDGVAIDLEGTSGGVAGPVNIGAPHALAACRIALKAVTSPDLPATDADFTPLTLALPEDCILNAVHPAPTFLGVMPLIVLIDLVFRALAHAVPNSVPAGHYGDVAGFIFSGVDPRSDAAYVHLEPEVGGWGATADADGENAMINLVSGSTQNVPAEVIETRFPIRLEQYALRPDSGGPGRRRGGVGIIREYRLVGHAAEMSCFMDRSACPPWGLLGGGPGARSRVVVQHGDGDTAWRKATRIKVEQEGLVRIETGGGGGWGDPRDREPELIHRDLMDGYVTAGGARRDYGADARIAAPESTPA